MKLRYIFFIIFILSVQLLASGQGLKILGNDQLIDDRSSYVVFKDTPPVFKQKLVLDFEISLANIDNIYSIGYILRIKNEEENTTYNILINNQGANSFFKFNHEGYDALINASFEKKTFYQKQWIKMQLAFDLKNDSLRMQINDEVYYAGGLKLKDNWSPGIYFGRSEHVIDIPTFELRNLSVSDIEKRYFFPLNESNGTDVHDSHKKIYGNVHNPVWLVNDAYFWKDAKVPLYSNTVGGTNFNTETQDIYFFNEDSICIYNVLTKQSLSKRYNNFCPVSMQLGTNFLDKKNNILYVYEVIFPSSGKVSIASLNLETLMWSEVSTDVLPTQLHHHSSFFDEINRRYIIFGGFGNASYNRNFYAYDLETKRWDILRFEGDKITPRYFSSMGYSEKENALYIFGGMGNESGDQFVGRIYYYDLYKIDLNENKITRLWEIPWNKENAVPVRNLIIDGDNFYTLCYPEHFSRSWMKLYRFSLSGGQYDLVGDSIPVVSEKIKTNANIYNNRQLNELYSIVQEFELDDTASRINIYSLMFPPVAADALELYYPGQDSTYSWLFVLIALLFLTGVCMVLYLWKRKKNESYSGSSFNSAGFIDLQDNSSGNTHTLQEERTHFNSIYLFGDFTIYDKNSKDITYMLSTKLKQTFLLILKYSFENGITTQELSEILWPDKPEDKVKNSRGVRLNNIRKILAELEGIKLVHEKGLYKIITSGSFYCDYLRSMEIEREAISEKNTNELLAIISRGKFLKSENACFLDSFKEKLERALEPLLFLEMEKSYAQGVYHATVRYCDAIFSLDPLNETVLPFLLNSLLKLKKEDQARRIYLSFIAEYKNSMNEDYPLTFDELVNKRRM